MGFQLRASAFGCGIVGAWSGRFQGGDFGVLHGEPIALTGAVGKQPKGGDRQFELGVHSAVRFAVMPVFRFEIDANKDSVQTLPPPSNLQWFEGVAFAPSGNIIAVAAFETHTVFLFRRAANGRFEETPYAAINGPRSKLDHPHDVSFARYGDTDMLAVAQRGGAIAIFEKNRTSDHFGPEPAFEICGPKTKLDFSDAVAFVPPNNDYLAAANLNTSSVSFYRRIGCSPVRFEVEPVFELKHSSLGNPDGLAFSQSGEWLAVANHGKHSVSVFRRGHNIISAAKLTYGPRPVTVIKDPSLRHPHSVAFTPETNHLVVTNAGANCFTVYAPGRRAFSTRWSQLPVSRKSFGSDGVFKEVQACNRMEGGPKGIAIHKSSLAVCSPEQGLKIYSFREPHFVPRHTQL